MSTNTAPVLPTNDYTSPSKPPTLNISSHGYSRSSPAAAPYESPQGYTPYTPTTPGGSLAGPSQTMSTQQRNISHTPLGLADIRPRADSSLSDGASGSDLNNAHPSPSNYLAPWALYAFDWCKWAPSGNGAGKVAIGSYLEDGHNFVSTASVVPNR